MATVTLRTSSSSSTSADSLNSMNSQNCFSVYDSNGITASVTAQSDMGETASGVTTGTASCVVTRETHSSNSSNETNKEAAQLAFMKDTVMKCVWRHSTAKPFQNIVINKDSNVQSVDLFTIKRRLVEKKYANVDECIADFSLLFQYCMVVYKPDEDLYKQAKKLRIFFDKKIQAMPDMSQTQQRVERAAKLELLRAAMDDSDVFDDPFAEPWSCSLCTFSNFYELTHCEICGEIKPNTAQQDNAVAFLSGSQTQSSTATILSASDMDDKSVPAKQPKLSASQSHVGALSSASLQPNPSLPSNMSQKLNAAISAPMNIALNTNINQSAAVVSTSTTPQSAVDFNKGIQPTVSQQAGITFLSTNASNTSQLISVNASISQPSVSGVGQFMRPTMVTLQPFSNSSTSSVNNENLLETFSNGSLLSTAATSSVLQPAGASVSSFNPTSILKSTVSLKSSVAGIGPLTTGTIPILATQSSVIGAWSSSSYGAFARFVQSNASSDVKQSLIDSTKPLTPTAASSTSVLVSAPCTTNSISLPVSTSTLASAAMTATSSMSASHSIASSSLGRSASLSTISTSTDIKPTYNLPTTASGPTPQRPSSSSSVTNVQSPEDVKSSWSCAACTYLNHPLLENCECCGTASNIFQLYQEAMRMQQELKNQPVVQTHLPPPPPNRLEIEYPGYWTTPSPNQIYNKVEISQGTAEFAKVMSQVLPATSRNNVQKCNPKVYRIENVQLYQLYAVRKVAMDKANGPSVVNEKWLWHGTAPDSIENICASGFNRSYCGKNATAFGKGVYFSNMFTYSEQTIYSPPDATGLKTLFLCRVLAGLSTIGSAQMVEPPLKAPGTRSLDRYNSVTDNPTHPSMYVIFHDAQVYPEYMLTFLTKR